MKPILIDFKNNSSKPLYIQLYKEIRGGILSGEIAVGEKLPSLRSLSKTLGVSITTIQMAYDQLLVEGYITSRPQSGYYVSQVFSPSESSKAPSRSTHPAASPVNPFAEQENSLIYDDKCFDFNKWKKCTSRVFNDYSRFLFFESDPQGEAALRFEISKYVFSSRGVECTPEQVVVGAGTQQITGHLCRILSKLGLNHVALESPGYLPVQSIFTDNGFTISHIAVDRDGIDISKLPANISSAAYVSPSNQFPTGAVMPVGRRRQLIDWAERNNSIIIEDDYDSELRYFGKPVPALRSLDTGNSVVYLGSFSSTLFPAIKIAYMVLPEPLAEIFDSIKDLYTQTCSKAEQLTLALFMEDGYYATGIRKLRNLYSQKLDAVLTAFAQWGGSFITPVDTRSGINLILRIKTKKTAEELCAAAKSIGLQMAPLSRLTEQETTSLIFYYSRLPLERIDGLIKKLITCWL